jgi:hypothetical protein
LAETSLLTMIPGSRFDAVDPRSWQDAKHAYCPVRCASSRRIACIAVAASSPWVSPSS